MISKGVIARRCGDGLVDCQSLCYLAVDNYNVQDTSLQMIYGDSSVALVPSNFESLLTALNAIVDECVRKSYGELVPKIEE